ncbi:hypothetical protein [Methanobrevibacter sp.]|uniref:hypothetical protein n=1 Tax=Methanobrevibacter sp. TaxID=66852 RepID=UPI0038652C01
MNRKVIFLLVILVGLCAISHVAAADNASDVETSQNDEMVLNEPSTYQFNGSDYTFADIKSTIESAEDGDKIYLNGTFEFSEEITIAKSVTIEGIGDGTTINREAFITGNFRFFKIDSTASNVVLNNIRFTGTTNINGGAILWKGNGGVINNCEFAKNEAPNSYGGAIFLDANGCNITNCTFKNNEAGYGGAIFISGNDNSITSCQFERNNVNGKDSSSGGSIFSSASNLKIDRCSFKLNHAVDCGGAVFINSSDNNIFRSVFEDNYIEGSNSIGGGAVFSNGDGMIVDNCTFNRNRASSSKGGAVILGRLNTVKYSSFTNNSAATGNDIYTNVSSYVISNNFIIKHNETKNDAVYGISETDLDNFNNHFDVIKVDSSVTFSAGIIFDYGSTSSPILVKVDGGKLEQQNIIVLNHPEAKITFSNNRLTVSNLAVGKYVLRATTSPDDNHNPTSADINVTVNRATAAISASSIQVQLKKGTVWKITLINSKTGKPIANMELTLKIFTGKKYKKITVRTNSKGIVSFKTGSLSKGRHKIIVSGTHPGYNFNTVTSYIKVIKPTALKFKVDTRKITKKGALISFQVLNKKTKKGVNGIKVKLMIKDGKKYKTIILKTKRIDKLKGIVGIFTNEFSVGKHIVKIKPVSIKYTGSGKSSIVIKKSSKRYSSKTTEA